MKNLNKKRTGTYQARIRFDPSEKIIYRSLKTKNHAIALKRLDQLYTRLELEREGMLPPEKIIDARNEKVSRHISRYLSDLEITASSSMYINAMGYRLRKLSKECGWGVLKQIESYSFVQWRSGQKLSIKTLNDYLSGLNCFLGWLVDNGFLESNPIEKVKRIPVRGRHKFSRRSFTTEEIERLLSSVPADRKLVYVLALTTGLRRGEIDSLNLYDFHLKEENPYASVRGETTKNGKDSLIYLHSDAVELLNVFFSDPSNLFITVPSMVVFKSDLVRAGIEYENSRNERADFHALRHTFCTRLAKSGISPQIAKQFMRHSDINLTTNIYTDVGQLGTDTAVQVLPSLLGGSKGAQKEVKEAQNEEQHRGIFVLLKMMEMLEIKEDNLMKAIKEKWYSRWESNPAERIDKAGIYKGAPQIGTQIYFYLHEIAALVLGGAA